MNFKLIEKKRKVFKTVVKWNEKQKIRLKKIRQSIRGQGVRPAQSIAQVETQPKWEVKHMYSEHFEPIQGNGVKQRQAVEEAVPIGVVLEQ